jgi:hypothetical protein
MISLANCIIAATWLIKENEENHENFRRGGLWEW